MSFSSLSLGDLLDDIQVVEKDPNFSEHDTWPDAYPYGVYDTEACLGLFPSMKAALQYRLAIINQRLNAGWDRYEE
jgi:hypothetical protein